MISILVCHSEFRNLIGVDEQRQAGLAVPSGPWQRRQEGPKITLDIASDNLEEITSSSTLQLLSHVIMHCYRGKNSAGTQQSHIFSWRWQSGPHVSAMVQAGWHNFPREGKCVRGAAASRGVCVSSSWAQWGRDEAAQGCQLRLQIMKMSLEELFCSRKGYRNFS